MKGKILSLVLLAVFGVANAQAPGTSPPADDSQPAERRMERLATLLDLTDTQKTQVKAILDAEHAKMRAQMHAAMASGTKPSYEQMHAVHEQLRAETLQQLTPVLTATQLKKFQVLMEDERGHGGHGPHGPPPPAGDAPSDSTH